MTESVNGIESVDQRTWQFSAPFRRQRDRHLYGDWKRGADARRGDRPISNRDLSTFGRPFRPFTAEERLHLDLFGYVIIPNLLTPSEVAELRDEIYAIEERYRSGDDLDDLQPAFLEADSESYFRIDNLPHLGPPFFDYLTHPRILGRVEDMVGGPCRLQQSDAHIRRPANDESDAYLFHRGSYSMDPTIRNGMYFFPFCKALTNLTDLGPDDGGTSVIPGSHKLFDEIGVQDAIKAALADPRRLIHQVEAPAGSTVFFWESLLHSSGVIRSGRDRVLVLGGYTPHMLGHLVGLEPSYDMLARLPEDYREFFLGGLSFYWPGIRPLPLSDPARRS